MGRIFLDCMRPSLVLVLSLFSSYNVIKLLFSFIILADILNLLIPQYLFGGCRLHLGFLEKLVLKCRRSYLFGQGNRLKYTNPHPLGKGKGLKCTNPPPIKEGKGLSELIPHLLGQGKQSKPLQKPYPCPMFPRGGGGGGGGGSSDWCITFKKTRVL